MLSKKMEQATSISSCSRNRARVPNETGMEEVLSDLQALKGLYGLLHKGQANENLDEASRALFMRMLDDATKETLLRQAKMLSSPLMFPALERKLSTIQPDRWTRGGYAEERLKPVASPSISLHASERSRRLTLQRSVRSRDSRRVDDHRRGRDDREHLLAHVASNRSSRTAVPWHRRNPEQRIARLGSHRSSRTAMPRHHPNPEQRLARLGSHRSSRAAEPQRGTVSGSAPRADRSDGHNRLRRGSGRGDQSSLGEGSSSSSRSVSREPSARGRARLRHGCATDRHLGAEDGSSSRRFGRLVSELSVAVMSRRGSERTRRGAATSRRPSSSSDVTVSPVTTRSRIGPNRELLERGLRRAEEAEEESPPRRRRKDDAAGSVSMGWSGRPRRALNRIGSGSTYSSRSSSGAGSPSPSTSPTAPSSPGASAYCSSSSVVSVSRRRSARLEYAFEVSSASRSRRRRRRERQERRAGRLRKFKNKLALVFHHRHDHHHHHHIGHGPRSGTHEGPSKRDRHANHGKSPWSYLGGIFHRATGHDGGKKKTTSRTVVTVPAKRRSGGSGGGHGHSLFDALVRHKWGARRARRMPARARAGMRRTVSRVQVKKTHWWQQMRRGRRSRGRPRRRLGQGKSV